MLGFGFNKTKVLASAEKNAKQGRLQNAITDYERVLKEEPNDLNVLNTIGDLYAHVGNIEQASAYFQRVGDAYASEGFTVKAIAMYKKLTKQNPNAVAVVLKLAELYAQQGLNNDARVQYTAVAEQNLRNGDAQAAAGVFQKILDLDPDNPQMQGRLAEIYGRLGKKVEARDVYFRSAQTLRARGALEACDDALGRVLKLDPTFSQAVLFRAQVRMEANDAKGAVQCLEALPDLDSRPEALRVLLRAHLKLGHQAEAEPAARKLLTIFNETSGIVAYCDWLMAASDFQAALQCYEEYATQLLTANAAGMLDALHRMIGPLKNNSHALETLSALFHKAGNTTHLAEVTELLAHASVQDGALAKARDLYKKLSEMEPENPLHLQNYNQILSRLEADSGTPIAAPEEGEQALMAEELEDAGSAIEQNYSEELAAALQNAFTDAELFESYNLPVRALPPLEAMLARAPRDLQLNRRLASLYVRTGRFADAAQRCLALQSVYGESGCQKEAAQYGELAAKYAAQTTTGAPAPPPMPEMVEAGVALPDWTLPAGLDATDSVSALPEVPVTPLALSGVPADAVAHEIDLSDEWERVLAEQSGPAPAEEMEAAVPAAEPPPPAAAAPSLSSVMDAALSDLVEEARFYLSQSMVEEARVALARAEALSPKAAAVRELRVEVDGLSSAGLKLDLPEIEVMQPAETGAPPSVLPLEPGLLEVFGEETPASSTPFPSLLDRDLRDPIEMAAPELPAVSSEEPSVHEVLWDTAPSAVEEPITEETPVSSPPDALESRVPAPAPPEEPVEELIQEEPYQEQIEIEAASMTSPPTAGEPAEDLLTDLVAALSLPPEMALPPGEREPLLRTNSQADAPTASTEAEIDARDSSGPDAADVIATPAPVEAPAIAGQSKPSDVLSDFVLDLEESLGDDFALAPPATHAPKSAPIPPPAADPEIPALASADDAHPSADNPPAPPVPLETVPEAGSEANSGLADLFAEFKQDVESSAQEDDDPETHYNLGVAFKEMGLLDEAIGELQKVCKAIEHGHSFPQVIEAYTWLADCFVQNGMPEAGVHWYEKALHMPGLDHEGILAIHYELACAQEAAGDLAAARSHFMRVLSNNIDYRDVAERIKNLKS
jgi:tetratricopeptide (TPR) repeat protein